MFNDFILCTTFTAESAPNHSLAAYLSGEVLARNQFSLIQAEKGQEHLWWTAPLQDVNMYISSPII